MAKQTRWKKLDNAAKIFPPTASRSDTKVFRFSCELFEKIDKDILAKALNSTLERFPYFLYVLRKGFFWYFLEKSELSPEIKEENDPPCSTIYNPDVRQLLFNVTYFRNRINFEVFHALTDGTGAMEFLKTLVTFYLFYAHGQDFGDTPPQIDYDGSISQMENDSFTKYYSKTKSKQKNDRLALRLKGEVLPENRIGVIEGIMNTKSVILLSKKNKVTVTQYLTAVLIYSIIKNTNKIEQRRPITVSIPVNMRQFFKSVSARNFFVVMNLSYIAKEQNVEFNDVLADVSKTFYDMLKPENLEAKMNKYSSLEHNYATKLTPLPIKIAALKGAGWLSEKSVTAAVSNIGKINMPQSIQDYIKLFSVVSGTQKVQICLCSYRENMVVSISAPFVNTDVQRTFFRHFAKRGIDIEINTNLNIEGGDNR